MIDIIKAYILGCNLDQLEVISKIVDKRKEIIISKEIDNLKLRAHG